jgi:DNA mismatch repair protein MutL
MTNNKIRILPENLASKIAAGEVVQRPASVVKELLENTIDAGATKVTIIIKDGGKTLIQVIDDGCGMNDADAQIAFQRHSTSKISSLEDLENIHTLGFRGEALASIAAVSQVELITGNSESDLATKIRIEGIEIKETTKTAFEKGTSVTVKNLFFNTPARRNFLKNNTTEFKHVFDVVIRAALSNPNMAIKFVSGEETVFNLQKSNIENRVRDIFGDKAGASLIPVDNESGNLRASGFVSKPDFSRKTRVDQFLFMNGRYIVSRNLNYAVHHAYENLLEKGSYPFFILYITLDPQKVDVNVHPSKMEVKFQDERSVYHVINSAVRNSLAEHNLVPSVQMNFQEGGTSKLNWPSNYNPSSPDIVQVDRNTGEIISTPNAENLPFQKVNFTESQRQQPTQQTDSSPETATCFQLHTQYIIIPIEEGVMIIDQHAAHERILYERIVANFNNSNTQSQQLLFPYTLEFSAGDAALIQQLIPNLEILGFQIKIFGKNTVILEGVPADVKPGHEETILQELVDLYKENEHELKLEPRDNLAKSFACRAAIKFGEPLNQSEMRVLVDQLFKTQMPYVCPHGRPAVVKLSLSELGKRFGR